MDFIVGSWFGREGFPQSKNSTKARRGMSHLDRGMPPAREADGANVLKCVGLILRGCGLDR